MLPTLAALTRHLRLLTYSLRAIGAGPLVRNSFRLAIDSDARNHDSGFDGRFGTDTTTGVTPGEAEIPVARRDGATMYLPTMDADLAEMLEDLAWTDERMASATFVDIGSGKGRVVLLAAMRRFRQVIGVELSEVLHAIAERNVQLVGAAGALVSPVRLVLEDAATFAIPEGPLVLYLYHPFREDIARQLIERVVASIATSPRPVAVIYGHPTLQAQLDPGVFSVGDVLRKVTEGARVTHKFRIGWSIWTNEAWLAIPQGQES